MNGRDAQNGAGGRGDPARFRLPSWSRLSRPQRDEAGRGHDQRRPQPGSPFADGRGIPLTTSLKGGVFRVRLKKGTGGLPDTSEAACEQIVQVPKRNFLPDAHGVVRPMGSRLDDSLLDDIVAAVGAVIGA